MLFKPVTLYIPRTPVFWTCLPARLLSQEKQWSVTGFAFSSAFTTWSGWGKKGKYIKKSKYLMMFKELPLRYLRASCVKWDFWQALWNLRLFSFPWINYLWTTQCFYLWGLTLKTCIATGWLTTIIIIIVSVFWIIQTVQVHRRRFSFSQRHMTAGTFPIRRLN